MPMIGAVAMHLRRWFSMVFMSLLLCGCGRAFAVRNDTSRQAFIDAIYKDHERAVASQPLAVGAVYSAPRCWTDIAALYLGEHSTAMVKRKFESLCKASACNCTINASQL